MAVTSRSGLAGVRPAIVFVAVVALVGCTGAEDASRAARPSGDPPLPRSSEAVTMDPASFTTEITNRYWPMTPGTRWVYREVDEDGERLRVVVTVSSRTRRIANGVTARVVRDTVSQGGEVVEDTFDWYAQDASGTVWYLGEDTVELEDGEVVTRAGSFEAGVDGALAGVVMPARPTDGQAYRQEYYVGEAEDNGEVLSTAEMVDVPAGHFDDAVLTKDTATIEPNVLEYKLYAPEVGPVLALGISGGAGREELLEMTSVSDAVAAKAGTVPLGRPYG